MAWASAGQCLLAFDVSAGTSIVGTCGSTIQVGNVGVALVAKDNAASSDGTGHNEVTSVTDSQGNTWAKAGEFVNANGAANAGATIAIFYCVVATELGIGVDTITANFSDSRLASAMIVWEYTVTSGAVVAVAGSNTLANDAADPGSVAVSGLSSREYLFIRAIASESSAATLLTNTSLWFTLNRIVADTGVSSSSMGCRGEYRILTGTGATSDPTLFAADHASLIVALTEDVPAGQPAARRMGRQPFRPVEIGRKSPGGVWMAPAPAVAQMPSALRCAA